LRVGGRWPILGDVMRPSLAAASLICGSAVFGCGKDAAPAPTASSAAPPSVTAAPSARATSSARAATLELQRFRLTSNVERKEAVDDLVSATPGERVWAHATLRNRTGETKRVSLIFRVDGDERTTVDLRVEPSWSWRTWGYVTLRPTDREGVLTVELRDEHAELLAQKALTIREKAAR
jgi:Protein of unknown function (DUF2914)